MVFQHFTCFPHFDRASRNCLFKQPLWVRKVPKRESPRQPLGNPERVNSGASGNTQSTSGATTARCNCPGAVHEAKNHAV